MKRYSEVVLNGHPDKFCDLVADRIIREVYKTDSEAYAQIEVSVWSDVIFLTGGVCTRSKTPFDVKEIIYQTGIEVGYTKDNYIDVTRYKILDHICWLTDDPRKWTHFVNDQSIVVGYAGYDALTRYLPPEHFLAWYVREKIINSLQSGILKDQGPDGKILIVINEDHEGWHLSNVIVTLQQQEKISFIDFADAVHETLQIAYLELKKNDLRWCEEWQKVSVLVNPNGPLLNGGSDGDNGQTGRKLVMDFYGPRIPIGGGALYGKDLTHIDRLAAFAARRFALDMVMNGSKESIIKICFAPGIDAPISIDISSDKRPHSDPEKFFDSKNMRANINIRDMNYDVISLGSFYNGGMSFNKIDSLLHTNQNGHAGGNLTY